jgi:hypothetical protein
MSQPDDGRYKSRGRKERTPEQLKVLAMAREKAKLVIAEKTKIKKEMASAPEEVSVPEPVEEPEPAVEDSAPEEVSVPEPIVETPEEVSVPPPPAEVPVPPPPPPQPSLSRDEIQNLIHSTLEERRTPERKYAFVDGMYVKIK